jgi:hypothetical protein
MEIQDMQKQLKSLSILLKSDLLEIFCNTRSDYIKGMMWERNTAVRYFITTRSRKDSEDYIGLMTAEDTFGKRIVTKISVSKFYEAEKVHKITIMIINRKAIALMLLL